MNNTIKVNLIHSSRLKEVDFNHIPFGRIFSDHMFVADYYDGAWQDFRIEPYQALNLAPATTVFHYAQTIFEGMKIMKSPDGTPILFRMDKHAARLNASAKRMAMPEFPAAMFQKGLSELVSIDHRWIPDTPDSALYVRPFMIATDPFIGVSASKTYKFIIFTAPVGAYYSEPVKLWASEEYVRAVKGGTGNVKAGGNYAGSLLPHHEAQKRGFDQVMWLDAHEHKYIHESGTMNLFFIIDGKVITPSLDSGAILPGITRDSFIHLLRARGLQVEERPISIDEVIEASNTGQLEDIFGSGTAAVVAPVDLFHYRGVDYKVPPLETRKISSQLKEDLTNLRSGKVEDTFGWTQSIQIMVEG